MMSSYPTCSDLQLARRLQAEEDELAALELHQSEQNLTSNNAVSLTSRPTTTVHILDSDSDNEEMRIMSPDTQSIVSSALNTAFSENNEDLAVLFDSLIDDSRGEQRAVQHRGAISIDDEDVVTQDNSLLTVGGQRQIRQGRSGGIIITNANTGRSPSEGRSVSTVSTAGSGRGSDRSTAGSGRGSDRSRRSDNISEVVVLGDQEPSTSSGRTRSRIYRGGRSGRRQQRPHYQSPSIQTRVIANGFPLSQSLINQLFMVPHINDSLSYEEMLVLDENNLDPGHGLSPLDISSNTVTTKFNGEQSCNICLCEIDQGVTVRTLPCFHTFHSVCIDNWLCRKAECPVCRHKVGP
eukprot:sb/3466208/